VYVIAQAPLRISFAGGGTDVPPFPRRWGGEVLSVTVDHYVTAAAAPTGASAGPAWRVDAEPECKFARAIALRLGIEERSDWSILSRTEIPSGSGLGGSSALAVALVALFDRWYGVGLSRAEIAHLAAVVEREDLGMPGGLQDHYAATYGGLNHIRFGTGVEVSPVPIPAPVLSELERGLVLCYTGRTRESMPVIEDQTRRLFRGDPATRHGLLVQRALVGRLLEALLGGRLSEVGPLLDEGWNAKRQFSPLVSTPEIDAAYRVARDHGADGGKLSGAGGGGFLLLHSPPEAQPLMVEALRRHGCRPEPVRFSPSGVQAWPADSLPEARRPIDHA
jgi:D-glycero-alpha-D-manno-heptose-7-phosphate kinase